MYCSPCLQAAAGSTHGYDIVDYQHVNEELGGATAYKRMCAALQEAGMGQMLDIVPNHMAITGRENPWWWDVLENGPASRYSAYFDVDWEPPEARLHNTISLPVLADHYGKVLRRASSPFARARFHVPLQRPHFPHGSSLNRQFTRKGRAAIRERRTRVYCRFAQRSADYDHY